MRIGAKLDLTEDYIKKEEGALPIRLISYLIVKERFEELYELLKVIAKERKVVPYQGDTVRQMIRLQPQSCEDNASKAFESSANPDPNNRMLVEQVNELVTIIAAKQQQIDAYETEISAYKAEISANRLQIDACNVQLTLTRRKSAPTVTA